MAARPRRPRGTGIGGIFFKAKAAEAFRDGYIWHEFGDRHLVIP